MFSFVKKLRARLHSNQYNRIDMKSKQIERSKMSLCLQGFISFHFKNWCKSDKILILFRILSILCILGFGTVDTVMYSSKLREKTGSLQFIHGLRSIPVEIMTIIYASSAVVFGLCIEIYLLILQAIINVILIAQNCDGSETVTSDIIWLIKLIIFLPCVELCHRNFRKLPRYNCRFNSSARSMLKQALLLAIPMLTGNLSGLKALYRATSIGLSHLCNYETSHCSILDMYRPLFSYDNDICSDDLSAYVAGREQIRLLRDFILLNIVSYSVFNKHFLKIKSNAKYLGIRILLIILFLALGTSSIVSYIDPLFFIGNCRLAYTIIESGIFLIIFGLMTFNLYQLRHQEEDNSTIMANMISTPPLLP